MKPILNLNKHPKNCENLSLVYSKNVRLSNDGSCLQSEEALIDKEIINNTLSDNYSGGFKYIAFIPCNKELIIFVADNKRITLDTDYPIDIWRYNENLNEIKLVYLGYKYFRGKIKGDFTYNVNNELIIAIAESDAIGDIPLKTINLGKFEEDKEQLSNQLLPINPEVYIPTLSDYNYVAGNLPKGWYYIFVRYKIDNVDYTKWFDVGGPILVDNLEKQSIFKLFGYKTKNSNQNTNFEPFSTGILDHFNTDNEFSNEALDLDFINIDTKYRKYQIGVIYTTVSNIKSFKTSDINIDINKYTLNIDNIEEYDYKDILLDSYNIYNSKCIINYKNRLYASNYKENVLSDYDTSNIIVNLKNNIKTYNDLKTLGYYISENERDNYLTLDDELDTLDTDNFENDEAEAHIYPNLIIDNVKYNDIISVDGDYLDIGTEPSAFSIHYRKDNKLIPQITEIYEDPLPYYVIRDVFKIRTNNDNILDIEFYLKQQSKYTTANRSGEGYFKYTVNNKTYTTHVYVTSFNPLLDYIPCVTNIISTDYITDDILIPEENTGNYGTSVQYVNTKNSFIERKKNSTLIPGEVYNFYIHFVDKYGFETKGFKLTPRSMLDGYVPVYLDYTPSVEFSNLGYKKYALMKPNTPIFSDIGIINMDACANVLNVFTYLEYEKRMLIDLSCFIDQEGVKNRLLELYGSLKDNLDIKWEDVSVGNIDVRVCETQDDLLNIENVPIQYLPIYLNYYNKNNEALFKIPYSPIKVVHVDGIDQYGFPNINLTVKDVTLPNGYCGYFLSYELFEETAKCTGILTKSDFNDTEHLNNSELDNDNKNKTSKMYFYCSDFDIFNNKLQYNILRIESKNTIKASKNVDVVLNGIIQNVANLNNPESESHYNYIVKYYNISDYNIAIADDTIKNRFGLSTCLELPIIDELFDDDDEINIYKVSLLYLTNNNYVSEDKQLIKCTNVIYPSLNNSFYPIQYLNGHNTYNNFIVYDSNKFIFNDATNRVEAEKSKDYIDYGTISAPATDKISKFLSYIQIPCFKNFFYETKSFKNKPTNIIFKITNDEGQTDDFAYELGCIVKPKNSIDLFENKFVNPDNYCPKFYTNHRTDIKYLEEFDKMIRRSDIIQDESYSNAWRRFGIENYKVISENKGKITNLVGIGHYLLVHTEHSLFAFDSSNTLKTLDQNIQLKIPDIFDIDYRELITSDLGFAGLQDGDAYCIDNFGYIFYDNDSNRIFRFDEGSLNYIDTDIVQWLNKYKPNQIRFAVDKKSSRVLCTINIDDITKNHDVILSYNYGINKFIAFHEYVIKQAVNTKNELYLVDELEKVNVFNHNSLLQDNYSNNQCELQIIINDTYDRIKYLEYIIYRMFAVDVTNKDIDADSHIYPVEEMLKPYSGLFIRVYNDEVDTGWLDCQIDFEEDKNRFANYELPYWDKGNWNFSYLRDAVDKMRLYGNYFVVCFKFGGATNRFEFESLGYNITKDRRI